MFYKSSGKAYSYPQSRIIIVKSAIQSERAGNIFSFLKAIAESIGLKTEEGNNILANSYGKEPSKNYHASPIEIFPIGFNLSQKRGADLVFSNQLKYYNVLFRNLNYFMLRFETILYQNRKPSTNS